MSSCDSTINAVSIRASPRVLHRDRDAGFNTSCGLKELLKGYRRVSVEAYPHTLSSSIFYASDKLPSDLERHPYVETEFVTVDPSAHDAQHSLVYQDDVFDIDVMGMSVAPFDFGIHNNNELLVYSLRSDKTKDNRSIESVPYIHFDPVDAEGSGSEPNRFIPIPATKSLFMSYDGTKENDRKKQVFCRFFIMEIDQGRTSQTIKHSISGIGKLGNFAQNHSAFIPEFGIISPALSIASEVGKRALHSYMKADKVLAVDFRFLLAEREEDSPYGDKAPGHRHKAGDYLRYGYYFFLDNAVDGKLFANTSVSSQNLSLKLKRVDIGRWGRDDSEYFSLTGVSYLVIKVSRGRKANLSLGRRNPINNNHTQRIKALMEDTMDENQDPQDLVHKLAVLAEELGISPHQ